VGVVVIPWSAGGGVRTAVSGVRRAVWACHPLAGARLITVDDGYRLELSEQVNVDVLELLSLVDSAQAALAADPTTALTLATHCARSTTAVFLPGVNGTWAESWRSRLRGEIATALRVEAAAALVTDRPSRATRAARALVVLDG
jgi:two-component SAPR family response regulator